MLEIKGNRIYEKRFLEKLKAKVREKAKNHKEVSDDGIDELKDFNAFHEKYTVPLHLFCATRDPKLKLHI